jgi:hypothetical protein
MFGRIGRVISHRRAGPVASVAALVLAGALAASVVRAHEEEAFLRTRIAALAAHDASQLQAELVSCRATVNDYAARAAAARSALAAAPRVAAARGDRNKLAAELVSTPPAGIDVCARMESADQAVMKTLESR